MTNPNCQSCGGVGYTNKVTGSDRWFNPIFEPKVLEFCTAVYPEDNRIPPELRGQPCTPRTNFRSSAPIRTARYGFRDSVPIQTPSEKKAEARAAAAANKPARNQPSRGGRSR